MAIATGTALALGAAGSLAGSAISANAAKKAQQKSDAANMANAQNTNAQNEMFFRLSRGEIDPKTGYGSAILPAYFKGGEQELGNAAMDYFRQLNSMNANGQMSDRLNSNLQMLDPAIQAGLQTIGGRYTGQELDQRLANAAPLFAARSNLDQLFGARSNLDPTFNARIQAAQDQRGAIDQSLLQTMGQLNAERGRGGFYGNSTFDRSRLLAATLGARSQATGLMSQANLANVQDRYGVDVQNAQDRYGVNVTNAGDERAIRDMVLSSQMDLAPLAAGLQNAGIAYGSPAASMANYFQQAMSPMSFFRIGNQAYQNPGLPTVQPTLGAGASFGSALSSLGSMGLNYTLQNQLLQQMNNPGAGQQMTYDQFLKQNPTSWAATGQPGG